MKIFVFSILNKLRSNFKILRGKRELVTDHHKDQKQIHHSFKIGNYSEILIENKDARIIVAQDVEFRRFCNIYLLGSANLIIGKKVFFNNYCSINCLGSIEIGDNSIFGEGVKMYDHNHDYEFNETGKLVVERNRFNVGSIKIGANCWIGSNVTILSNVEIGDNVIIGANTLVYKSIPSNTIVKSKSEMLLNSRNAND